MNVTNRKMFRPRTARNKLNQMGGIMASSPELMQTVQKFQVGGPVSTQQQINRGNIATMAPGITTIQDFVGQGADLIRQANQASGIANMPTTPQAAFRSPKVEGPTGTQVLMGQIGDYLGDVFGPESPEEVQQRVAGARSVGETFGVPENAPIRDVVPDFLKPQEGPARGIFTDMTLEEKAAAVGLGPEVGRRITDPAEIARLQNTPEGRGQSPTGMPRPGADSPTMRGPTAKDAQEFLSVLPEVTPEQVQAADPRDQARLGQDIKNQATDFLASDADETEKNDAILTLLGKKDPSKTLSKKERIEKNKEFYREIFKQDPKEDEKIDGYNLAMMGFLIASGDSPNALQNIARGAAAGLKNFQETRKSRQAREDKLTELAVADYRSQVQSEAKREEFMMNYNLELQKLLDRRAEAKSDAERERINKILGMKDTATGLALLQLEESGVDIGSEKGFSRLLDVRSDLVERFPDLRDADGGTAKRMSEVNYINNQMKEFNDPLEGQQIRRDVAAGLGLNDPKAVTRQDAISFFSSEYRNLGGAVPQAPAPQGPPVISTREEYDALAPGAFFIQNGQQRQKPAQ